MALEERPKVKLKRRNCAGFVISVILFVVFIGALVGGSIFAVNYGSNIFKETFGFAISDVIDCFNDLGDAKREDIVTNPYDKKDAGAFYSSLNASLYFKDGTIDKGFVDDVVDAAVSATSDGPQISDEPQTSAYVSASADVTEGGAEGDKEETEEETETDLASVLTGILRRENFDADKLASYNVAEGSGADAPMTDRQMAAFLDDYLLSSGKIDELVDLSEIAEEPSVSEALDGVKVSELISLDQVTITKGSDMSESDKTAYGAEDGDVYMVLTMSLDVGKTVRDVLADMKVDTGDMTLNFSALADSVAASLPATLYFTAAADMSDADAGIKVNINRMAQEECKMGYLSDELKAEYGEHISKFDRLCIIVKAFSGRDVLELINEYSSGILGYVCRSDDADTEFCLSDIIDLGSVKPVEGGGNSFTVDAYGLVAKILSDRLGSNATDADIIALMQTIICTDELDALIPNERVDVYVNDKAALDRAMESCGIASVEDIDLERDLNRLNAAGAGVFTADPGVEVPAGAVNVYSGLLERGVFDAYGIEGAEDYTAEDIIAIMQSGTLTQEQQALLEQIRNKVEQGEITQEPPVFEITDKMLGSAIRDMSDVFGEEIAKYGFAVHSVTINESGGKMYADITASVTVAGLMNGADSYFSDILPKAIALTLRTDITPHAETRDAASVVRFNGVHENGSVAPLQGLTCGRLIEALENIVPDLDLDSVLAELSGSIGEVLDNLGGNFGDYVFVPSETA
ncbi:MAG TPA: hypothetical protein H9892_06215 [Candidatus Protoclostridium stercorigallinarum]|uniref:Uncharacterized protein n=1 Tax=Candidatus Protoclostridium stercorigallinarum TaxID=2838741 RepID=A0A9D1TS54_9FIRM|nr:hypothetical protein [Candidatus Protoclostridium stercorigallinarum]